MFLCIDRYVRETIGDHGLDRTGDPQFRKPDPYLDFSLCILAPNQISVAAPDA